jgi:hypothetical protein
MYDWWIPLVSASIPCTGGIIEPPNIIIIKNADPWLVYLPKPVTDNEKIDGHMIEQHKPPLINANMAIIPVVIKPMIINIAPNTPNMASVRTGFWLPIRKPITNTSYATGVWAIICLHRYRLYG